MDIIDEITQAYDVQSGFRAWSKHCQAAFQSSRDSTQENPLQRNGFDVISALTEESASAVIQSLDDFPLADENTPFVRRHLVPAATHTSWMTALLHSILSDTTSKLITNYFQSEFMIFSFGFNQLYQQPLENAPSYKWHRDTAPNPHMKGILYLSDCENTAAGTEVIDRHTSSAIHKNGYSFPKIVDRVSDLSPYTENLSRSESTKVHTKPGKMLLFQPREVLHRGLFHRQKDTPRITLNFVFVPSILPWQQALDYWPISMMQRASGADIDLRYHHAASGTHRFDVAPETLNPQNKP